MEQVWNQEILIYRLAPENKSLTMPSEIQSHRDKNKHKQ